MKFDDVTIHLGQFGRYQRRVYLLLCLPAISIAFQTLASVFSMAVPDHRCALPDVYNDTYTIQNEIHAYVINATIPPGDHTEYSQCQIYDVIQGDSALLPQAYTSSSRQRDNLTRTVRCHRWVYDKSLFASTLITKFDLVCEHKLSRSHAQMFYMLGSLFGALCLGTPADVFGRKKLLLACVFLHLGASLALVLTSSFIYLCVFTFLNGAACTGLYIAIFVIGMELVGPEKRVYAGFGITAVFGVGVVLLSGLAYLLRHWQHLQLSTSSITVFFISYYWLVPESPRWLIARKRYPEAEDIIRRIARVNRKELPAKVFQFDQWESEGMEVQEPLWRIITYPRLVVRTLIIYLNWMVCSMTYYGLHLNVGDLAGSVYVNSVLYGSVEILSYIVCPMLLDRLGRKKLHLGCMFLAGIACTASPLPHVFAGAGHQWLTILFALLGKFGVSGAFATIWMYSGELFPTVVRNSGISSSSLCARIGGVIAPYIANLGVSLGGQLGQILPLLIFGVCSLLAGMLALALPETTHTKLPETLKDADGFGRKVQPKEAQVAQMVEMEVLKPQEDDDVACGEMNGSRFIQT